jgi:hypothetical protein
MELDPELFQLHRNLLTPEIHQRIIQQILQDIPNCRNNADDIIIFAKTQEEHDKTLRLILQRLREKNLTLNKTKCEFNNVIFHLILSDETTEINQVSKIRTTRSFDELCLRY